MKRSSVTSFTTQYIVILGAFFLMASIVLSFVLHWQSSNMVQTLIRRSMLNVSNTAADLIDGDVIGALKEEDIGSEKYQEIYDELSAFQNNTNVEYIYAVRQVGPEKFVFTVDPDPEDPGEFGEEIVVTDALRRAGNGIASVDDSPAEDEWGNFYSAYSPIFDSKENVAGIIGVDFSSSWYDDQIWKNTLFVIVISILFTLLGLVSLFILGSRMHKRFEQLNKELAVLSGDVEELTQEILESAGPQVNADDIIHHNDKNENEAEAEGDEILRLGSQIHGMHKEIEQYLDYMHVRVNTDALTKVGNTTAYNERIKNMEYGILNNTISFSIVMFDINNLKQINDKYGHIGGDKVIRAAASVIADVYGRENTYRIGGDEFIAITDQMFQDEAVRKSEQMEELIDKYNRTRTEDEAELSLSQGQATFVPGDDHSFRDVFVRADERMYLRKDSYHNRNESERKG